MDIIISDQLTPINLNVADIYLDPNNPRFVGDDWRTIHDDEIDKENIQSDTRKRMARFYNVEKLRMNMEVNGYLPIDRIIVRRFKLDKYVVLEGNRRITAAKQILSSHQPGSEVSKAVLQSLSSIPCLEYTGSDTEASWIFQGIRHITGIVGWSAYNKAKLLSERWDEDKGITLTEVGKQFGLSRYGAGQWIRGYRAFRQAKDESNYSREIDEKVYPYFQELFGRSNPPLREWLGWNENEYKFENELHLDEFLSWIYPKEDPGDGQDIDDLLGEWDKRIIGNVQRLRDISYLLRNNPQEFQRFRSNNDLDTAISSARVKEAAEKLEGERQPAKKLLQSMDDLIKRLGDTPTIRFDKDDELKKALLGKLESLQNAVADVKNAFSD